MGSKRVGLARTQALIENLKRELNMNGTGLAGVTGLGGVAETTAGAGAVSGSTAAPVTRVTELNGEILTTIQVDLHFLSASAGAAGGVIGNVEAAEDSSTDGDASAHLLRWSHDTNGIPYKVEMSCIELPAGCQSVNDINLASNSSALSATGSAGTGGDIINQGAWTTLGTTARLDAVPASKIDDNDYIYLTNGATVSAAGTKAQFSGGKYVIKFYGYKDF